MITPRFLLMVLVACLSITVNAQTMSPVEVVQKQLDHYNKQETKAFAAMFAEDVLLYQNLGDSTPAVKGRMALEKRYGDIFSKYPMNHCTLLGRMVQGNFVIDHEWITGREQEMRIMAIYEVVDGLIRRCWFIR